MTRKLRVVNPVSLILEAIQASPRVSVSETSPFWADTVGRTKLKKTAQQVERLIIT